MPPHGHGHGGGHGGGHHHGHRGGGFTNWSPGWGPGWYGGSEIVVQQCPGTLDPVLATDGRVYNNPCEAQAAGYAVVRRVNQASLSGVVDELKKPQTLVLAAGMAVAAYLIFFEKRRHKPTMRSRVARIRKIARQRR